MCSSGRKGSRREAGRESSAGDRTAQLPIITSPVKQANLRRFFKTRLPFSKPGTASKEGQCRCQSQRPDDPKRIRPSIQNVVQPAFLTTWRGEVRERAVRGMREPLGARRCSSLIASFGPRVRKDETRPLRFTGRQTFLLERTRPPPMVFPNHETRNTKHGLYTLSTAGKRNEVMAVLSRAAAVSW